MGEWEWMCEWMFVFTMPFLCADSGPWRKISRAWPGMSAITTSSVITCPPTSPLDRKRTSKRRHHVWWVERFLLLFVILFLFLRRVQWCMGMEVWVNVFTMPFLCANSGPWRTMSRAWPAMSAITTSSGSTCPSHQESAWGAAVARQEKVIVEVARKAILAGKCYSVCAEHIYKCFLSVLS